MRQLKEKKNILTNTRNYRNFTVNGMMQRNLICFHSVWHKEASVYVLSPSSKGTFLQTY